jgi:hypothetical protein
VTVRGGTESIEHAEPRRFPAPWRAGQDCRRLHDAMNCAFKQACARLELTGSTPVIELVALRILELASAGESDPEIDRVCGGHVRGIDPPALIERRPAMRPPARTGLAPLPRRGRAREAPHRIGGAAVWRYAANTAVILTMHISEAPMDVAGASSGLSNLKAIGIGAWISRTTMG